MPIKVACRCGRTLIVPDQRAGRSVQCPKCRERIDVPGPAPSEPASPRPLPPQLDAARQRPAETTETGLPRAERAKGEPAPQQAKTSSSKATDPHSQREAIRSPSPRKPEAKSRAAERPVATPAPSAAKQRDNAAKATPPKAPAEVEPQREKRKERAPTAAPPASAPEQERSQPVAHKLEIAAEVAASPPAPPPPPESAPPEVAAPAIVAPPPVSEPTARPAKVGYHPDAEKLSAAYVLAMLVALLGLFSMIPGVLDVVRYLSDTDSAGVGRWSFVVFFLGLIHLAYALYLGQLPDWSSSWVLTAMSLLQASLYAAVLTAVYMVGGQSQIAQMLDLGPHIDNGQATAWCFVMLCMTGLVAYFCGHVSIRWRRAFLVLRAAYRH